MIVIVKFSKKSLRDAIRTGISILLFTTLAVLPSEISHADRSNIPMPLLIEPWKFIVVTIVQEAALESFKGKVMVAEVIRDRTWNKYNSNGTIIDTVLRPYQFSGWNTEERARIRSLSLDITEQVVIDSIRAYELAFNGRTNYAMGANLYHADYMNPYPEWTKSPKVIRLTQEGHHIFYREDR